MVGIAVLAQERGPTLPGGQEDPEAELDRGEGAIEDEQSIKIMKKRLIARIVALDVLDHTAGAGGAHTHHLVRRGGTKQIPTQATKSGKSFRLHLRSTPPRYFPGGQVKGKESVTRYDALGARKRCGK